MSSFLANRWKKEGPGDPAPSEGAAAYFYKLGTFFWRFMTLNCLFLLASLPVVTMPVALTATNRVCIKLIRSGNVLVWEEFRDEFKSSFKKGLLMGLFFAVWMFVAYYIMSLGVTNWENPTGVIFMAVGAILFVVMAIWASYGFVLLASLDLPLRPLLKNARILMFLGRKWTLAIFAVLLGMALLLWLFFPITLIVPVIGGIALMQYTISWFVDVPMQQYIIGPYERSKENVEEAPET